MSTDFDEHTPIWRQLAERLEKAVMQGALAEGEAFPSVRTLAADFGINPQTILKAFDELRARGLAEKRRGEGLYVTTGSQARLLDQYKARLVNEELPALVARAKDLAVGEPELVAAIHRLYAGRSTKKEKT